MYTGDVCFHMICVVSGGSRQNTDVPTTWVATNQTTQLGANYPTKHNHRNQSR